MGFIHAAYGSFVLQYHNVTLTFHHRRWSINCPPFRHILFPINILLVVSLSCVTFPSHFEHNHSCRSFQISTAGWYVYGPIQTSKKFEIIITVCLRQAGEMLPDRTANEEINDSKFGQLMRNKTVHLLSLFLMVYIGVEVTIGGIIFVLYDCRKSDYCKIRMDCNIFDDCS